MHSILIFIYLLIAGIASGLLSSMAGLASLISYPVLLSLGLPPVNANVTNTASLVFTGIGSGISSVTELKSHKEDTIRVSILSIAGAVGGSLLLTLAPASTFQRVVPLFIFMAGCLMLFSLRQDSKPFFCLQKKAVTVIIKIIFS